MNEMPPTESTPDFPGKTWAMGLGAMLLAAFAGIVLLAFVDREGRTQLEAAQVLGPVVKSR